MRDVRAAAFAQWIEEHPGWKIRRWRCTTGKDTDI